ncbi:hypothetical protein HZZ00_18565 [Streptomyces sp. NEAU-sy36]|uniref:hypothetical protein n=1 Tax=unclassified Streptomyces TaxID=2593676 RepID=UPI0015D634BB|nr:MULTISPECIES: hypothetical protein [unclassified Streptomyces]QLI99514.1 hypothetical protein HZZ00_18565 [Streptomyces sp. NEAU-sy36]
MTCDKADERARLFYAVRESTGRKGQSKGFGWRDFPDLIVRARIQLGGPIVLVWDNPQLPDKAAAGAASATSPPPASAKSHAPSSIGSRSLSTGGVIDGCLASTGLTWQMISGRGPDRVARPAIGDDAAHPSI